MQIGCSIGMYQLCLLMHYVQGGRTSVPLWAKLIFVSINPSWLWWRAVHKLAKLPVHYRVDKRPHTLKFTPMGNFEWLINLMNLTCRSLDCGEKPDYLKGTHADKGRTWGLKPCVTQVSALTTVLLCCACELIGKYLLE